MEQKEPLRLSDLQKDWLLKVARQALEAYFSGDSAPDYSITDAVLLQNAGVFVTLWTQNRILRGCIGRIEVLKTPLFQTVQSCAVAAAERDIRFAPVSRGELDDLIIEISVLTRPQHITDPSQIEVGRHGLIIRQGGGESNSRTGLLLPQVATSRNWTRLQFLEAVCKKAMLPLNAWQTANLSVFECDVFEEEAADHRR